MLTEENINKWKLHRVRSRYSGIGVIMGYVGDSLLLRLDNSYHESLNMERFIKSSHGSVAFAKCNISDTKTCDWIKLESIVEDFGLAKEFLSKTPLQSAKQFINDHFPKLDKTTKATYIKLYLVGLNYKT
jgi:hypothetical protein